MTKPDKTSPKPPARLMSQATAARRLGVHRNTLLARIAAKEIEAEETTDGTLLPLTVSVEAYLARQREAATAAVA